MSNTEIWTYGGLFTLFIVICSALIIITTPKK
jgi:hypothetical protein